ncbi:MAG: hypothetical protein R3C17_01130 [Planctomycetaceae bacterium]
MTCQICSGSIVTRLQNVLPLILLLTGYTQAAPGQTKSEASPPGVQLSLDVNSHAGTYTYVPEEWGDLHLRLENGSKSAKDLLCTTFFEQDPGVQFGRQVWLPPQCRLRISHPILFPQSVRDGDRSINVRSLVIDDSSGEEVLMRGDSGQLFNDRSLLISPPGRNTGIVVGSDTSEPVPQDVLDLVVANRVYQGLDSKLTLIADQFLPSSATVLNYLDHLVISDDRLVDDQAAMAAVRTWLHAGGRLWIMLDRTDPVILERLLGDGFQGAVVDRVELSSVRVDLPPSVFVPEGVIGSSIDYDDPVNLARVMMDDLDVRNTVDGWPAALTGEYGRGRLLITTLGARGWMKPAPPFVAPSKPKAKPKPRSDFVPLGPMEDLAPWILAERESEALPPAALESFAKDYVSYSVPNWSLVIGTMGIFLIALVTAGGWFWKRELPEHFAWIGSLLAVIFGAVFVGIGIVNRYGVPDTIASVYFAQAIGGSDEVRASGVMAVYRPEGGNALIQATQAGELLPDLKSSDGTTRRMVTTDLGVYHWDGLSQPAGLAVYPASTSETYPERLVARATLDTQGFSGHYTGPVSGNADAILATRQGRLGVNLAADGQFTAGTDAVLNPDQFVAATFLTDVQDRRRKILQKLYENRVWQASLVHPQLMLWLNDWNHGFEFGDGLQRQGDTLLMVPLELKRPAAGTEMTIPWPLISFKSCKPPDNSPAAGFWDDERGEWQERSKPSTTWLAVQVPHALLPMTVSHAQITVKVSGAMGQIEVLGVDNGNVVSLGNISEPVGVLSFEIDKSEVLSVSRSGELTLGVRAGLSAQSDPSRAEPNSNGGGNSPDSTAGTATVRGESGAANYWRIESLTVQLQAHATEQPEEE